MTAEAFAHPGLVLIVGAALVAALRGPWRAALALALPIAALALVAHAPEGAGTPVSFIGLDLAPMRVDALSRLFGVAFAVAAIGGVLYGLLQPRRMELPCALLYAGAALGVVFAGDLLTVFLFWELMAIGSTLVIWSNGTPRAFHASMRYLIVHLFGGTLLLLGIAARYVATGSLAFDAMTPLDPGAALILAAFLVNAGAPPLWAWVADAYPEANATGTVFLSAFTTKAAVYALLRGFPGVELLIPVGLAMAAYGLVYAAREGDLRRLLAYGIVNQVGVMLVGIGIGTAMAKNGVAAQAFTHILYKALLLMAAGAVLQATGRRSIAEVGGLARSMPWTALLAVVGVLSMAAPLTLGFVSKSMIAQAAGDLHRIGVWLALAVASAGVFVAVGLRFVWFTFFGPDSGLRPPDPPLHMRLAMLLLALLCIGLGVWYEPLYRLLPFPVDYAPYTGTHVVAQLQLLLGAALVFFVLRRFLAPARTITLDVDWLYRRALPRLGVALSGIWYAAAYAWHSAMAHVLDRAATGVRRMHGPEGLLARTWSVRSMGLWMLVMLLGLLLIGYAG